MLLSHHHLHHLVADGILAGADQANVNSASIDVRLGHRFLVEEPAEDLPPVDLVSKQSALLKEVIIEQDDSLILKPGEFVLAETMEVFNLPDYIACEFRLRSSMARNGLDQALAVWVDPGFTGSVLTIELRNNLNYQSLLLTPGMRVGQLIFYQCYPVPQDKSYSKVGKYNDCKTVTASRGHDR